MERPAHSKLGASGAERWMNCPGSVALLPLVGLDESDEPDYRREGTAQHEAAAHCLRQDLDGWEVVGEVFAETKITPAMAKAIQVYLDYTRSLVEPGVPVFVEYGISSPVHELFYGTLDWGSYSPGHIRIIDYKGGAGVVVEAEENPQLKYYAFGLIDDVERQMRYEFDDLAEVTLAICQPNAFHPGGPIRSWSCTVKDLKDWVYGVLVPAMLATEYDDRLTPGEHCRFCPAKLVCPALTSLFGAAAKANAKHIPDLRDDVLAEGYPLIGPARMYLKAYEEEVYNRLRRGVDLSSTAKLVRKRADRVLKEGAAALAEAKWGPEAFTSPLLKSPAQLEGLPGGAEWVKEWAFTPDTGLTVAPAADRRQAVAVKPLAEAFAGVLNGEGNP